MSMMKWTGLPIDPELSYAVSAAPMHTHIAPAMYSHIDFALYLVVATLESIIRQERDNLVLKLNSVVQRYTRQTA